MKVLVAEDDKEIRDVLSIFLRRECFAVDAVDNGEDASYMARTNSYDLILLDHVMPKLQGRDVCRDIRKAGVESPVILLTVCNDPRFKVDTLNCGADDFLCKPYAFDELLARMRAVLRRPKEIASPIISIDTLVVDQNRQAIFRNGQEIILSRREYTLLAYMARNAQRVLSRGELLEHVWERDTDPFSNTIEVHIGNLRRKIGTKSDKPLIHTIQGRGYRLDDTP